MNNIMYLVHIVNHVKYSVIDKVQKEKDRILIQYIV